MVGLHEMIEAYLCQKEGIKEEDVTNFDMRFEGMRESFPDLVGKMEPGNHDLAPYNKQHLIATRLEKWLCDQMLGEGGWEKYDEVVNNL